MTPLQSTSNIIESPKRAWGSIRCTKLPVDPSPEGRTKCVESFWKYSFAVRISPNRDHFWGPDSLVSALQEPWTKCMTVEGRTSV